MRPCRPGTPSQAGGDFCSCHAKQIDYIRNHTHAIPNQKLSIAGQSGMISNFFQFESNTVMLTYIVIPLLLICLAVVWYFVKDVLIPDWFSRNRVLIWEWIRSRVFPLFGLGKGASCITASGALPATNIFIGRDEKLAEIKTLLAKNEKMVLLSGLGGIGKTEICRKLYEQCLKGKVRGVQYVGWIQYTGDLRSSLSNQFPAVEMGNDTAEDYCRRVQIYLNGLGQAVLLLIDNMNAGEAWDIAWLNSLSCKIILTSRQEIGGMETITIGVLSKEQCRELYRLHSKDNHSSDDVLNEIIELSACHTLAVELLAKTQKATSGLAETLQYQSPKSSWHGRNR